MFTCGRQSSHYVFSLFVEMTTQTRQQWEEHNMRQALQNVENNVMGFKRAAATFHVPKTTLRRRLSKQQGSSKGDLGGRRTTFPAHIEKELVDHIIDMETRFFGLTTKELRQLVFEMAERNKIKHTFNCESRMAGWKWVRGFLRRNPQLSLRTPESTSLARAQAFNKPNISAYFLALSNILEKFNFPPENIYNMDESGLTTVQKRSQKVYAAKGRKQVGSLSSAERGQHVTVVCAMNAIGTYVPPAFIFPRKRLKEELMNGAPPGSISFAQEKGWMTSEIFTKWLQHFLRYTKASNDNKVLLLLDGHGSHKGLESLEFAKANGIVVFCFPAHCSHHVQPLDVGFFRPLHTYYGQEIQTWLRQNPGKAVTPFKIANLFNQAYLKSALPSNAISAFKKTGIHPVNPDVFEDWMFSPSLTTDRQRSDDHHGELQPPQLETDRLRASTSHDSPEHSENDQQPEPSGHETSSSIFDISIKEICPFPSTEVLENQKRGRKRGKTGFLNSTPEIAALKETAVEKETRIRKQCARRVKRRVIVPDSSEDEEERILENLSSQDDSDDAACIYCNELYSCSRSREKWIRCQKCNCWCHAECAGVDNRHKSFVCELC